MLDSQAKVVCAVGKAVENGWTWDRVATVIQFKPIDNHNPIV